MADISRGSATQDVVTLAEVKTLAGAESPCITLVIPISNPLELTARLKSALRSLRKQLEERHTHPDTITGLLAPIEQLGPNWETAEVWANSLIAFRSPGAFRHYWIHERRKDLAVVGERFEIRPLLAAMAREQRFYLLAIGRHHVRLFRSTPQSAEEVRLEGKAPQSMQEFLHTRPPDHLLESQLAGPSAGSMRGVVFGTSSEPEKEQERFRHFLKEVERGVTSFLGPTAEPLLLAGVVYDVAIYRQLNTYPHLLAQVIDGSPDGQTAQHLHERAREIMSQCPSEQLKKALEDYRKSGAALLLSDASAIGKAAAEGRVAGLFLLKSADAGGQPDEPLNIAALETVLHGGWAFELNPADMPTKNSVTALLRF
jgi:hypothetical protein